jgi:hypothetical protein
MKEKVKIPLMVTGGFRRREVMEQAVESGSADLVGIGRPMCVDTDAPGQLLAGAEVLNRYEQELSLLPSWLAFLGRINSIRSMASFAVQFWYYAQLDILGITGKPKPELSVFAATRRVLTQQKKWMKARNSKQA